MTTNEAPSFPPAVRRLSVVLPCVGAAVVGLVAGLVERGPTAPLWLLVLLGAAYVAADRWPVHVQFRGQSVATELSELVTVMGFFLVGPVQLLVVRFLAGFPTRLGRPWVKKRVNLGLVWIELAVAVGVMHLLVPAPDLGQPLHWLAAALAVVAPAPVSAGVLTWLLRIVNGGRATLDRRTIVLMVVWPLVATCVGIIALVLLEAHPAGALLVVLPAAVLVAAYRDQVRERAEAERVRTLYELASSLSRTPELESVLAAAVTEARDVIGCQRAELVLRAGGADGADLVVAVDVDGSLSTGSRSRWNREPAVMVVNGWLADGGDVRAWVDREGAAVPLRSGADLLGGLAVWGRPAGRGPYGTSDLAALRGLAGQLAGEVARSRLTAQLRTADDARTYLESHDVLTGLGNRRWFTAALGELAHDGPVTVALCNLRGFRLLNERFGQTAGDRLLVAAADQLRAAVPDGGVVARLGGDEFAIAVAGAEPWDLAAATPLSVTAVLRGEPVQVPMAAGVVHRDDTSAGASGLLRAADLAMGVARERTGGGVVVHDEELEDAVTRQLRIGSELGPAIAAGDVVVHFQPIVELDGGRVVGVEALARWTSPTLGVVRPDEFVAVAEARGVIGALTSSVLAQSCAAWVEWAAAGIELDLSVNVSVFDIADDRFPAAVAELLRQSGVPAERLLLEITESAVMEDPERARSVLERLGAMGVRLAIDDFGTGHSSLAQLHDLPVDEVKVDRFFVARCGTDPQAELIVRTVAELARTRGLVVVAEGVEDEETVTALQALGVDLAQGWHYGRPGPASGVVRVASGAAGSALPAA